MTPTAAARGVIRGGTIAGLDPGDLAAAYGTPFFAYDLGLISERVAALRHALPPTFDLAFAVKANPLLAVLRHLGGLGVGADVASAGELRHVLRAGFRAGRIVMTGPGKRDEELVAAVDAGIGVVTVESRGELRRLATVAEASGRVQPVLLRLSTPRGAQHERVRIISDEGAGKFGMDAVDLRAAAAEAVASPWLDPLGIHGFGASNVLDAGAIADHVDALALEATRVAHEAGFRLRVVDAGGGLGIAYDDLDPELDLALLARRLHALARRLAAEPATADARVLLEPGRYLTGPAGVYVTRVTDRKTVAGAEVAILDGGIHHVLRPALVGQQHRVVPLIGRAVGEQGGEVTLAGPLCTGLDIVATGVPLAALEAGDLVAVLDLGAYGATESMPFFLSHPLPAEVVIDGGSARLARPRVEPETWLGWQLDGPQTG